jgi:hypothetical protein
LKGYDGRAEAETTPTFHGVGLIVPRGEGKNVLLSKASAIWVRIANVAASTGKI